jgi:hypothetical protein
MGRLGKSNDALGIYERLLEEQNMAKAQRLSMLEGGVLCAKAAGKQKLADKWSQELLVLKTPPTRAGK